jgi:molecular chaperone GrpE (heat shock protein)
MVDRVYKASLPRLKADLERLREEFSRLGSTKTDWIELRIDPLLRHLDTLEELLRSEKHSLESSRLRKGVTLFHSDLVYLRENVRGLERVLDSERKSQKK